MDDDDRTHLKKVCLKRWHPIYRYPPSYLVVAEDLSDEAYFHRDFPELPEAVQAFAGIIEGSRVIDQVVISATCAGDSRMNLPDALVSGGCARKTVVGHLRIDGSDTRDIIAKRPPHFDFKVSQYVRLVTSVFDEVHDISFDEGNWVDFAKGITSIDFSHLRFTVPWGTPASAFSFLLDRVPEKFQEKDRSLSLRSVPGLTAEAFYGFIDDITKLADRDDFQQNFEFRFEHEGGPDELMRHPKLHKNGATNEVAFANGSVLSVHIDPDAKNSAFIVRYRRSVTILPS
ncbi:hypothetical protein AAVH_18356, partial [Aphelenchoides avenae]